ncbi:autocrine proliferation repressor protein A-like isoform X2 [Physella acuta]|nr:autocrine proliferation repressor protein A-like isoform X2 [Physella acuta]XP_059147477.1 autocrine proliferation repressor protein A-like isoform X2 [Physella acuta]
MALSPSVVWALCLLPLLSSTPLDDYVNTPDLNYDFTYLSTINGAGFKVYILNMTSQKWLTEEVTTTPLWWHYLSIIVPTERVYTDSAILWISAGNSDDSLPNTSDRHIREMASLAVSTKSVTAVINQVPFQPTVFLDDPTRLQRSEDAIIAWTWRQFLDNGSNPEILLRLPMTKAVVRGMDTVALYAKTITGDFIHRFVIGGESKRGWTTWTTAAVDKRVVGMVPTVMDLLNVQKNLHHHFRSLGGWTFAFDDYYRENITDDLDGQNMPKLAAVVDPLTYASRYTIPKMIVSSSGDEFFLPDDSHYYFDLLPGPTFLRIIPNSGHSVAAHSDSNVMALQSFYLNVVERASFPVMTWVKTATDLGGKIELTTSEEPAKVTVYYTNTLDDGRRDFRVAALNPNTGAPMQHPVLWQTTGAIKINETQYEAVIDAPASGWAAFYIQVQFNSIKNSTLEFTTEVNIVPDTFPFPDCSGSSCYGKLV